MSDPQRIIERMFARMGLHDRWDPPESVEAQTAVGLVVGLARQENQVAARRLTAVAALFAQRVSERGECEDWAVDTWAAVEAELAAGLGVTLGRAGRMLSDGLAIRRLPAVAAVFGAGDIDLALFRAIADRTDRINDAAVMAYVDEVIARYVRGWRTLGQLRRDRAIDSIIAQVDPDAVRRAAERARGREITVGDDVDGLAEVMGRLASADAHLLDRRLDALAAGVCGDDPRTAAERRADAMGALAAGADRLRCRCGKPGCDAGEAVPSPVVIHVVAEQASLDGGSDKPGFVHGLGGLVSAELLRELAIGATVQPVVVCQAAESGYRPSRRLADFVRARDLTCRAPGCRRPAMHCDLDHTVAYGDGGATHASNIKCLCRFHHLLKTFGGWKDRQLPDGTVIWDLPDGQTYVTLPGSALLFPSLMTPAGATPIAPGPADPAGAAERALRMPRRTRTRAQNRAARIAAERRRNRREREAAEAEMSTPPPPRWHPNDPPPF